MSKKLGRNDPCHCGSGKKYKKCCLSKDAATRRQAASQQPPEDPRLDPPEVMWDIDDDEFEELTNSVIDLIHEGKLDEAEKACDELDRRCSGMIDCLDRRAMLLEARGETKLAAEYYRRAADHARTYKGFDIELADIFAASADRIDPPSETDGS